MLKCEDEVDELKSLACLVRAVPDWDLEWDALKRSLALGRDLLVTPVRSKAPCSHFSVNTAPQKSRLALKFLTQSLDNLVGGAKHQCNCQQIDVLRP
mgnify:FL=1